MIPTSNVSEYCCLIITIQTNTVQSSQLHGVQIEFAKLNRHGQAGLREDNCPRGFLGFKLQVERISVSAGTKFSKMEKFLILNP